MLPAISKLWGWSWGGGPGVPIQNANPTASDKEPQIWILGSRVSSSAFCSLLGLMSLGLVSKLPSPVGWWWGFFCSAGGDT